MIIEHSGDFKVVDPKTKEVRYDSTNVVINFSGTSSDTWKYVNSTVASAGIGPNYWEKLYGTEEKSPNPLEKSLSKKDQILELLKGETFEDIKDILEDVFEEVKYNAKY